MDTPLHQADQSEQNVTQTVKYHIPIIDDDCTIICDYTPASHVVDLRQVTFPAAGTNNLLEYTQMVHTRMRQLSVPGQDVRTRTSMKTEDGATVLSCEIRHKGQSAESGPKSKKRKS
jgi:hypothetical protein